MKHFYTLLILIATSTMMFAQTEVTGNQSGTWTADNSPYNVIGEITIPAGELLTIEPGVEVNFQAHYKFNVTGNLYAVGTETDSIQFTTDNPNTGWGGIRVDTDNYDDIITLSYCKIEYGITSGGYPDFHGGALALFTSNAVISNCVFADNDATGEDGGMGGAIYAYNTGDFDGETLTSITDCKFIRNHCYGEGGAIKFTSDGYTEITNCEFIENDCLYGGGAISFYSVVGTKMTYCLFRDNYTMYASGGAIHMLGMGNSIFMENCTVANNQAVTGDGGGVYVVNGSADMVNCIVYENPGSYSNDVYVGFGGSAEINYSNLTMPDDATGNNNIEENPLFTDADAGDYSLQELSGCIDAGTDIGYPYIGDAPDMGCYEYGVEVSRNKILSENTTIFPNPTTGLFYVSNINESNYQLKIFDISGKLIQKTVINSEHSTVNISQLNSGIYFIKTQTDEGSFVAKIIKQ